MRLPGNIPVGLAALLVGTAIGWIGGYMSPPDVATAAKDIAVSLPTLHIGLLAHGLQAVSPLLATAIPLGIYNFTEGMTNVESAAAAGDKYNLRSVLLADGTGAIVGSALGSPFPPAVYIGHPGWKEAGGRTSYSMASGAVIALLCFLGMFGLLGALIPIPAIVPILLYIGLLIGAQAFQAVPRRSRGRRGRRDHPEHRRPGRRGRWPTCWPPRAPQPQKVGEANLVNAGVIYKGTQDPRRRARSWPGSCSAPSSRSSSTARSRGPRSTASSAPSCRSSG